MTPEDAKRYVTINGQKRSINGVKEAQEFKDYVWKKVEVPSDSELQTVYETIKKHGIDSLHDDDCELLVSGYVIEILDTELATVEDILAAKEIFTEFWDDPIQAVKDIINLYKGVYI